MVGRRPMFTVEDLELVRRTGRPDGGAGGGSSSEEGHGQTLGPATRQARRDRRSAGARDHHSPAPRVEAHRGGRWPIRPRFMVAWETGLRPTTLAQLRVPENYRRGTAEIVLDDADDKARYGRSVPLSETARLALDAVCPAEGLLFGKHNFDKVLKAAAAKVLGPELAKRFASYDFRHGRATQLADEGASLPGSRTCWASALDDRQVPEAVEASRRARPRGGRGPKLAPGVEPGPIFSPQPRIYGVTDGS